MLEATHVLASLTPADQPLMLVYIVGGLMALSGMIRNVVGTMLDLRQLKGSQQECVTRAELREVHGRVDAITVSIAGEIGKMHGGLAEMLSTNERKMDVNEAKMEDKMNSIQEDFQGIQRSLGRLEGLEKIVQDHSNSINVMRAGRAPR